MKIYLAHALTNAPKEFLDRMVDLRRRLNALPGAEVLQFAWIDGVGPKPGVNVYEYDMDCVAKADLMIAILDHFSFGVGMEIQYRSQVHKSLILCAPKGMRIPKIIPDCIDFYQKEGKTSDRGTFISYQNDGELFEAVLNFIKSNEN